MRDLTSDLTYGIAAGEQNVQPAEYEGALVKQAQQRSNEAWATIYDQHYPAIFRYMTARLTDRETAEDLAATVFVEAIKRIDSYNYTGRPVLAWLYGIARNQVNFHLRTAIRRSEIAPVTRGAVEEVGPGGDDPAALIERWDVREAIGRLSDDQREVIALRYYVGLSTPEAAVAMGKHERAVYSLHARALQALRRRLGDDFAKNLATAEQFGPGGAIDEMKPR